MSASDKKRMRKEQSANTMTERQKQAQQEAKTLKAYTWTFWIIMLLIVSIVIGVFGVSAAIPIINRNTHAITVGNHELNAVELNYFYIDVINDYYNQNSSWIRYLLNVNKPLDDQVFDEKTGATWADNFLDMAIDEIKNTYALYDAAVAAGHKLTEDEQTALNSMKSNLKVYAEYYGHRNVNDYLSGIYGKGSTEKSYLAYYEISVLANSYYNAYAEQLKDSYTEPQFREYEKEKLNEFNAYSYLSFSMNVDKFKTGGTKGEDGKITYTEEELQAARDALKKAAEELAVAENNSLEKLNEAIKNLEISLEEAKKDTTTESKPDAQTEGDKTEGDKTEGDKTEDDKKEEEKKYSTATENKDVLYSSVAAAIKEWLTDAARQPGDIAAIPQTTKSTDADGKEVETLSYYYVIVYQGVNDNKFSLVNVRHVLISFEGGKYDSATGQTKYTDEEKKAAKEKAEKLLKEWQEAGDVSENSFAELAKKNSKDNAEDGGLYEEVYPGQMLTNFNDWCFAEGRKAGDTGVVETEYGYHIMFFSGNADITYRDYMIRAAKQKEDVDAWEKGLIDAIKLERVNTKRVDRDLILGSGY